MTGISNLGTLLSQRFLLAALRDQVDDTQRTISSGKKSTNLDGLGTMGASNAISFRNKNNLLDRYTENINGAKTKLTVQDAAFSAITADTRDMLSTLRSQLQQTSPKAAIIADQARQALASISAKLNEQVNGQYIFAGDDLYNAPYANTAAINAGTVAANNLWLTGGITPAALVTTARGSTGTALGFSASVVTAGNVSFLADDKTTIDYTTKADSAGFSDIIRGLTILANLRQPTTATEQTNYWNIINGTITLLDAGAIAVDTDQGLLGNKAKLAENLLAQHSATKANFEEFIGTVEDADMADASTRFQALQSQMQMSYSVIAQLKDLSLVNYL